jgi:hypothetical protein
LRDNERFVGRARLAVRPRHWVRFAVNLANGSTLAGVGVGLAGRVRLAWAPEGLLTGTGYRLPIPPVPAFTMGSVILTRRDSLPTDSALFRHEARHSTQYAWCGGVLMLPLYFAAAGASWVLSGDVGAWNLFERRAGLVDGGYADVPLRPVFLRPRQASHSLIFVVSPKASRGLVIGLTKWSSTYRWR